MYGKRKQVLVKDKDTHPKAIVKETGKSGMHLPLESVAIYQTERFCRSTFNTAA